MAASKLYGSYSCVECPNHGGFACKKCLLVLYCSRRCQQANWSKHKVECRSPLMRDDWMPRWIHEDRVPSFIEDGPIMQSFGGSKYFWGNVPAIDLAHLKDNEGENYDRDFPILLAASGDLRNIVETISGLPKSYQGIVSLYVNDRDFDIAARNLLICLVAFLNPDEPQSVECMLHLWYSAFLTPTHVTFLSDTIRPLIEDVITKIEHKPSSAILGKTWTFASGSCRAEFSKTQWVSLISYLEIPAGLSQEVARCNRAKVTLAPDRKDHLDRHLCAQTPAHRLCLTKFREDGILLPFGQSRYAYTVPNPTFFRSPLWPMMDSADPLDGWSRFEVLEVSSGAATQDIYGKLHGHVLGKLTAFRKYLTARPIAMHFLCTDAQDLPLRLHGHQFARIEVSNIADGHYMGAYQVVTCFGPLLQSPSLNKSATLIMFFMNAVREAKEWTQDMGAQIDAAMRAMAYFANKRRPAWRYDPMVILSTAAADLVLDCDAYFDFYMRTIAFDRIEQQSCLEVKRIHSIIAPWPLRLKLRPGQPGAQKEFELLQSSGHTGTERYVEWQRSR